MNKPIRPRAIQLEASSFCQLRCPSCPTTSRAIHPAVGSGFLRFDDFRELLDQNRSLERIELSNYGEIFLNPDLLRILELAYDRGVVLSAGNGVNLNAARQDVLEGVVKYRLRAMTCSIDGASEETYSIYRVRGKFSKVISNIKTINEFKRRHHSPFPVLRWQYVVFGHNEHELSMARAMARELAMEFHAKLSWDPDFSPVRDTEHVSFATGVGAANREEYESRVGTDYMQNICHQLWDSPQINWDGKVLGCCRNFWGDFGGNAFRDGLEKSLNGEKIAYARDMVLGRTGARDDIPCTTCDIYHGMREQGRWLDRGTKPQGSRLTEAEVLARAIRLYDIGHLSEAGTLYRLLLAHDRNHPEALLRLGVIAHELGDSTTAIDFLRRAASLRPKDSEPRVFLTLALEALSQDP